MHRPRPGTLGGPVDYAVLADLHRPDVDGVRREALRLIGHGWPIERVASALKIAREQVAQWIEQAR